jgi:16S rRNA (adenine(1408)-N(1))-methyltransferase
VIIDLGTGDGRAVLARAGLDPGAFVIGIDANAAGMAEASRRADRGRSRLENAMFLVEAVEALPGPLAGVAGAVYVTMPWGSLLRGVLGLDASAQRGIASVVAPGGRLEVLVSVAPSDGVAGMASLDGAAMPTVRAAWAHEGFQLTAFRMASTEDLAKVHSSWARRLRDRTVWRLELCRGTGGSPIDGQNGGH